MPSAPRSPEASAHETLTEIRHVSERACTPRSARRGCANSQSRKSRPRRSPADLGARLSGAVGLGDLVLAHGDLVDAATRVRVGP